MANTPTPNIQTKKTSKPTLEIAPQTAAKTIGKTTSNTAAKTTPNIIKGMPTHSNIDPQSAQKLKQSLGYIAATILLALAGYFGWTYWQSHGRGPDTVAADKYAVIEEKNQALQLSEDETTRQQLYADIDALVAAHGDTVFAWQALMIKANNAAYRQDYAIAVAALEKAASIELHDAGLKALAQLRYAAVLLAKGDVDKAMTQASKDVPMSFEASQQELLGDIYVAKNDNDSAIRSYNNAWAMLVKRKEARPILRLKLESLGVQPVPIAPAPQVVSEAAIQTMVGNRDNSDPATSTATTDPATVDTATINNAAAVDKVASKVNSKLNNETPAVETTATAKTTATENTVAATSTSNSDNVSDSESP